MNQKNHISKDEWKRAKRCKTKYEFELWWKHIESEFNWSWDSQLLIFNCKQHFEIWWDPEKFNWGNKWLLEEHCQRFEHIWKIDYVMKKLGNTYK